MAFILKWTNGNKTVDFLAEGSAYHLMDKTLEVWTPKKKQVWGGDSEFAHGKQLISNKFENRRIRMKFSVSVISRFGS